MPVDSLLTVSPRQDSTALPRIVALLAWLITPAGGAVAGDVEDLSGADEGFWLFLDEFSDDTGEFQDLLALTGPGMTSTAEVNVAPPPHPPDNVSTTPGDLSP